jgi:23S rRNA pseudouridine955/2504/2580 synthase
MLEAFKQRYVQKTYLCFAKNNFKKDYGYLTAYHKKDANGARVYISDSPKSGFAKIVTEYKVEQKFGDYALVSVTLHTGKTHQIRAHLAHIGCPILGDEKYGDQCLNKKYGAKRQILVAKYLKFNLSGEWEYLNSIQLQSTFIPLLPSKK